MYTADAVGRASNLTFGRETAQFRELVTILAAVSIVLWLIVFATILARLYLCHVRYRRPYQQTSPGPPST
jgi:heme/copper-type cytochrome/quinol oxidase subunit 2